jgi:hypothetical protein
MTDAQDEYEDEIYQKFKQRFIEEGFIEANPKRWVRPTKSEIGDYFCEKRAALDDAVKFFDYWDSLDWKVKNTRIKSWKGRANTWIKNNEKYKKSNSGKTRKLSVAEQVAAGIASRENENATSAEESGQIVVDYG